MRIITLTYLEEIAIILDNFYLILLGLAIEVTTNGNVKRKVSSVLIYVINVPLLKDSVSIISIDLSSENL